MKKIFWVLCFALFLVLGTQMANAGVGQLAADKIYSVNIIAYDECPKTENAQRIAVLADFDSNDLTGQTLVSIDKTNKIFLVPGDDFRVLDSLACDRNGETDGAVLQLEGVAGTAVTYELWIRLVAKWDSSLDVFLCATDPLNGNLIVCDTDNFTKVRYKGTKPTFTDASAKLLNLYGHQLFDARYENYFWDWGTINKPHAQLWFVDPAN